MHARRSERGMALVSVLLLVALLAALVAAYFGVTGYETVATRSALDATRGFYAAEAGANVRAAGLRSIFVGYNRPAGTSPSRAPGDEPCAGANQGSGDFACSTFEFGGRDVVTFQEEVAGNPVSIVIPRGELFQNLHAQEYRYVGHSTAVGRGGRPEALLEMHFRSRLVPMFQFAAFYNKDLEILPGPAMTLAGPVHANGDLYLGSDASLSILGQVSTAGDLYHGRKNADACQAGPVGVLDPVNLSPVPDCAGGRRLLTDADVAPWNGMIATHVDSITVPTPEMLDPTPGATYWDKADLRIVLDVAAAPPAVRVYAPDGGVDAADTAALTACGSATRSNSLYNNREATAIEMLDVDLADLLDCLHVEALMGPGKGLDDASEGGLVVYLGVAGPDAAAINNYGVRVRNGARLAATVPGAPAVRGLTVVTSQAMYVQGDYNALDKKPAAFLADSLNLLSNSWSDARSTQALANRVAASTTVQAAFLAGTDTTGGAEGAAGQDAGAYNGGLENYPRFHENWTGRTLTYRGSFVSLGAPRHVDGAWVYGAPQYTAPSRNWSYDTDFNAAENLPPLSPRFVYLRQELFTRHFRP